MALKTGSSLKSVQCFKSFFLFLCYKVILLSLRVFPVKFGLIVSQDFLLSAILFILDYCRNALKVFLEALRKDFVVLGKEISGLLPHL